MRIKAKVFIKILFASSALVIHSFILQTNAIGSNKQTENQGFNFNQDLNRAGTYWAHNKLASSYYRNGNYEKSIEEYQKAIQIIESAPDEYTRTDVTKEYRDAVNHDLKVQAQIFSRYGLADALEKVGRYEEALQNVEWLIQNQHVKGKEALLKKRLDGMKQTILQKIGTNPPSPTKEG